MATSIQQPKPQVVRFFQLCEEHNWFYTRGDEKSVCESRELARLANHSLTLTEILMDFQAHAFRGAPQPQIKDFVMRPSQQVMREHLRNLPRKSLAELYEYPEPVANKTYLSKPVRKQSSCRGADFLPVAGGQPC